MLRQVDLHRLGHRQNSAFGSRVRHAASQSDLSDAGRHVDDRAGLLLDHVGHDCPSSQINAADVHPHHAIEQVGFRLQHVPDSADAGVVEEHVDPLETFDDPGGEGDRVLLVGDVHMLGDRVAAALPNAGHRGLGAAIVNVGDDDASSFGGEQARGRLADPRAGTSDDTDLALEPRSAHARSVPMRRARPSAIRMIAPSTASIHVELMFERVRMLVTSDSRITPVSAPIIRPLPPSSEMPPMTAAANTPKMRFEP